MANSTITVLLGIGLLAGVFSGMFGIGGGVIIVPALIYLLGFSQHLATGTSLAVLLPPIGIGAVLEYYRYGNVNIRAAVVLAIAMVIGGYGGAVVANRVSGAVLRLAFSIFVIGLGGYLLIGACRRLGWF